MIKSKKAMAMETIVIIIIALVVLIVVLWIFKDQIGGALKGFTGASKEAGESLEGKRCQTVLGDRKCSTAPCPDGFKETIKPAGLNDWIGCNPGEICCEQVY